MIRRPAFVAALLFLAAAVLRLHDAWMAAPLSGYDGPFHASYIGIVYWDGRWPLPDEGWSTHHPPLYYALCALLWGLLPEATTGGCVLFSLRLVNVASGLALGGAVWSIARRLFPDREWLPVHALAVTLFLPMHVGPSVLLGNEIPAAALSALGLAVTVRALAVPTLPRAGLAGLVLGLGVATKLSVGVTVAAAGIALLARGWQLRRSVTAIVPALVLGLATLGVSGPYFVRNLIHYGEPVLGEVELSAKVMRAQGFGEPRPWADYLDPDPGSLVRPGTGSADARRAVWPVTFSTVWFDVHGTLVDVHAPAAQWMARGLYALGVLLTVAAAVGMLAVARGRVRSAVPRGACLLAATVVLALIAYVLFSHAVATYSVLKGTYLSTAVPAFAVFTGLGLDLVAARGPGLRRVVAGVVTAYVLASSAILWHGWLAPPKVNPADWYLRAYRDAPTERAFRFFVGRPRLR